jgi:RecJ-like exonuclease
MPTPDADQQVTFLCPFCPSRESRTLSSMAPDRWPGLYAWWANHVRKCAENAKPRCKRCGGTGEVGDNDDKECPDCDGTGRARTSPVAGEASDSARGGDENNGGQR